MCLCFTAIFAYKQDGPFFSPHHMNVFVITFACRYESVYVCVMWVIRAPQLQVMIFLRGVTQINIHAHIEAQAANLIRVRTQSVGLLLFITIYDSQFFFFFAGRFCSICHWCALFAAYLQWNELTKEIRNKQNEKCWNGLWPVGQHCPPLLMQRNKCFSSRQEDVCNETTCRTDLYLWRCAAVMVWCLNPISLCDQKSVQCFGMIGQPLFI